MSGIVVPSKEFLEENIVKHSKNPKAPYAKKDREARRNEVFRLHFELGYPAIQIAEMMKVNKNTIYNDINVLYQKFGNEWDNYDFHSFIMKQTFRLEKQRTRLLEELKNLKTTENKLSIERLLFDIDSKLMNTFVRTYDARYDGFRGAIEAVNQVLKDNGEKNKAFVIGKDIRQVHGKTAEKINKILKEDRKSKWGRS